MKRTTKTEASLSLHLRLRVVGAEKIALGPGKANLLALIDETGSIGAAAKQMELSYMKAWSLVQTMKPLVQSVRGGHERGGAELTESGRRALELYRRMERNSLKAVQADWLTLQKLVR